MAKKRLVFKFVVLATILLLIGLSIMLSHMLNVLDLSQQPSYQLSAEQKKHDFYLVTYADGAEVFFQNRNVLAASAINRGVDFIYNYRREHIDPEYIAKHPILNEQKGVGYWLWKPYIILKTLNSVPDGAIVTYLDSGLMFRQSMRRVLEEGLSQPGKDVLVIKYDVAVGGLDGKTVSGDIFRAVGCLEDRCRYGTHAMGGFVTVRNSAQSRAFIAEWLRLCENEDLITGRTFHSPNYPEFSHIMNDESILSALANRDSHLVNSISTGNDFYKLVHMHRRKTQERSLLGYQSIAYIHPERRIPNSWWMQLLRKTFPRKMNS